MKGTGLFWLLALGAFLVLGGASVWMGGLNQDEGWYLYAANLVAEGKTLYRDFFYTQGPVLPLIYSRFTWVWGRWGILGARVLTLLVGCCGVAWAVLLARRLAPAGRGNQAALVVTLLLGCNLYHLYYLAIPKSYALASALMMAGFYLLSRLGDHRGLLRVADALAAGFALALSAGTRVSLGALLAVVGFALLFQFRRYRLSFLWFGIGGALGLALCYGTYLLDPQTREGLLAAQRYHAARGGFDVTWVVGSLSRLVRWYLPVFVVLGLGVAHGVAKSRSREVAESGSRPISQRAAILLWGFLAVFAVQMLAPFPYEDYQVPVMGLLAVYAAVAFVTASTQVAHLNVLLVMGLAFATSFGSPMLEKWSTNGQDRFWSLKKEQFELAQLRSVAGRIRELDPEGTTLLTQDLYLAIETGRKVPKGLEMGPFSMLTDAEWRDLVGRPSCALAALSAYSFAIEPPACTERPVDQQMEYWNLLKRNYEFVERHDFFGQNATPLLILKRK